MNKIAIVGIACEYPDASNPEELWNNILSKRKSFRKIPKNRLPVDDYYSEDPESPDKIYSVNAAVIEGYEFDRKKFKVSGSTYRSTDLTHWLALDVATRALEDAGFLQERNLPIKKTRVIVGNTLTGEFSRSEVLRLRWPYVQKVINEVALSEEWDQEHINNFILKAEQSYKQAFNEVTEDTLAGGLSNTIAGRICNFYDFKGGGYTIDGACSSSLLSISQGCSSLISGEIDLALVGGVDLSLDPFELIGFSKTKALAKNEMKIYDKRANGFWPGEGCGFVTLMRYDDAIKQGHKVYATINGWGISSDGNGGLTRPEVEGQTLALERAYEIAGYSVDEVDYFEGHGTGTPVGDNVELTTINNARERANKNAAPAYISSIKGNIGHTKAAAGIAGLIKATMAIHHQIIPPATSCDDPHQMLKDDTSKLKIAMKALPWSTEKSLKAGVSSMGFGGINVHLTLEGVDNKGKMNLSSREKFISSSYQDNELFVFSGESLEDLEHNLSKILSFTDLLSYSELSNLSNDLYKEISKTGSYRAAIVAESPKILTDKIITLINWIKIGSNSRFSVNEGIYLGNAKKAKIGFLFPGQGAPVKKGAGEITSRFKEIEEFYNRYPEEYEGDLKLTNNAQPNIVKSSIASLKLLNMLNIKGHVGLGHSLGELTALYWSGTISEDEVIKLAKARGNAMGTSSELESGMASILANFKDVEPLLVEDVIISGFNAKEQTVISGGKKGIERVVMKAKEAGLVASILPVSHGFHSKYMEGGKKKLSYCLNEISFKSFNKKLISSITGDVLDKPHLIPALLVNQLTDPIKFIHAMDTMEQEQLDFIIEVGPGNILSKIAYEALDIPVVSIQSQSNSLKDFLNCAALSFVMNLETDLSELYNRYVKRSKSINQMTFFTNPCETVERKAFESVGLLTNQEVAVTKELVEDYSRVHNDEDVLSILKSSLAQKLELPFEYIKDDYRMLDDLHLNSITVGQIVAQVSNLLNINSSLSMTDYANSTVQEVAEILLKQVQTNDALENNEVISGVESWVGAFHIDRIITPLTNKPVTPDSKQEWTVYIDRDHPFYEQYKTSFEGFSGSGVIVALPPEPSNKHISYLLEGVKKSSDFKIPFVVIQHGWKTSSAFAKSFYLEKGIDTKVINVPLREDIVSWVEKELNHLGGFEECFYDNEGNRTIPILTPVKVNGKSSKTLSKDDVLLFTGGGRGIAYECALSLAKETGAKLALIGRANPKKDKELNSNLERIKALGITFTYKSADVTDNNEIMKAIVSIEEELGQITGFTHAAGINNPKPLDYLNLQDFENTIDTKLKGATNIIRCLDQEKLKFFVSFSSVIGRAGLQGESHYGLANEWLTSLTEYYNEHELISKCLSIEWSVWSGAGMGQDLGTLDSLKKQGITPIPLEEGIRFYKSLIFDLLNRDLVTNTVVISGRMGGIPTLEYSKSALSFLRFVEDIRVDYPGHELISDVQLSPDTDKYLLDHVLDGELLLPAVIGLEAIAQVSSILAMTNKRPNFEKVTFNAPIIIDKQGTLLRIVATKRDSDTFKVSILSESTKFKVSHFEAICCYQTAEVENLDCPSVEIRNMNSIQPMSDMYKNFLFQKGNFAKVKNYLRVVSKESLAYLKASNSKWFQDYLPQTLLLEDPGIADSAIHSIQACIPHRTLIPTNVSKILHFDTRDDGTGERIVLGREVIQEKDNHTYNLYIYDLEGQLKECWLGINLKEVKDSNADLPLGPLWSAYVSRKFRDIHNCSDFSLVLDKFETDVKDNKEKIIYQLLGKEEKLFRRENGSPFINDYEVSFSNQDKFVLGIASKQKVACDLERVNPDITKEEWAKMLGDSFFELATKISSINNESLATSCTRMWTVIECLKKSDTNSEQLISLLQVNNEDVHFRMASLKIGTFVHENLVLTILTKEEN